MQLIPMLEHSFNPRVSKEKTSFWASESKVSAFEIYHRFIGTIPSNPPTNQKQIMFKLRTLMEEAVVDAFRRLGGVVEEYTNDKRMFFNWGALNVPISGYPDLCLDKDGVRYLVEIKTFAGKHQIADLNKGIVKESYLNQLCTYMYGLGINDGILLMVNQENAEMWEFPIKRKSEYIFTGNFGEGMVTVDLKKVFERYEMIWSQYVMLNVEPPLDIIYKYDIEKVDWENLSTTKIREARNNRTVIGDPEAEWSEFKDIIIQRQGTVEGYTDEELKRIHELTDGYTSKKKKPKAVRF